MILPETIIHLYGPLWQFILLGISFTMIICSISYIFGYKLGKEDKKSKDQDNFLE